MSWLIQKRTKGAQALESTKRCFFHLCNLISFFKLSLTITQDFNRTPNFEIFNYILQLNLSIYEQYNKANHIVNIQINTYNKSDIMVAATGVITAGGKLSFFIYFSLPLSFWSPNTWSSPQRIIFIIFIISPFSPSFSSISTLPFSKPKSNDLPSSLSTRRRRCLSIHAPSR